MQKLLSALMVYQANMKLLHWKLIGTDFDTVHQLMSEYSDKLLELTDDIAEIGLQLDINPVSMFEAVTLLSQDSNEFVSLSGSDSFTSTQCFEGVDIMFNSLLKLYSDISIDNAAIMNKLQEHIYWIQKELYYKNKRRRK